MNKLKKILSLALASVLMGGALVNVGGAEKVDAGTPVLSYTLNGDSGFTSNYSSTSTITVSGVSFELHGVLKSNTNIQMNSGKGTYIKNTTAFTDGYISSIVCTWSATGKNSPTIYLSSGSVASTSSTKLGKGDNTEKTQTYTVSNPSTAKYDYFYFDGTTVTGACYMTMTINLASSLTALATPECVFDDGTVLIGAVENAQSYKIGLFTSSESTKPVSEQSVTSAEIDDIVTVNVPETLNPGTYQVKVQAVADGTSYSDSEWTESLGTVKVDAPKKTIAQFLEFTEASTTYYEVTGEVEAIKDGNVTITDGTNDLYIYNLKDENNGSTKATTTHTELSVKDIITVMIYPSFYKEALQGQGYLSSIDTNYVVVTFDSNGGSDVETQYVLEGGKATKPADPTKENAFFNNWYNESTFANVYDFNTALNEDKTIYAKWDNLGLADFAEKTAVASLSLDYTVHESGTATKTYTLVEDASTLKAGDKVVIAGSYNSKDRAMSTTQNSNNRGSVAVTFSEKTFTSTNESSIAVFKLETGKVEGSFAFYDVTNEKYLYACSSSSNYLRSTTTLDNNASWKITITDGLASVVAQGTYTRNIMRYNGDASSDLFACYDNTTGKNAAVKLYKVEGGIDTSYTFNAAGLKFGTIFEASIFDKIASQNSGSTIKYGVGLSITGKENDKITSKIECTPAKVNEDGSANTEGTFYCFYVAVNNIPEANWKTTIYATPYVQVGDTYYYMNEKHFSVETITKDYVYNHSASAGDHLPALKALDKYIAAMAD